MRNLIFKSHNLLKFVIVLSIFAFICIGCGGGGGDEPQPSTANNVSSEDVNVALSKNAEASTTFETLAKQEGLDQAQQTVLNSLKKDSSVADAFLNAGSTIICITYISGLKGGILTLPEDTKNSPDNGTPVAASFPDFNNATIIATTINTDTCMNCSILQGNELTLEEVRNFDTKGIIYLDTHGSVYGEDEINSPIAILTGEKATFYDGIPTSHLDDWKNGRIVALGSGGNNFWAFLPSFIETHCNSFPNSLVVISACHSYEKLKNRTMANVFLDLGAATYVGYSDTVSVSFSNGVGGIDNTFFSRLANGDTVQQAFDGWTITQRTDPNTGAIFGYVGAGYLELPKKIVVASGAMWYDRSRINNNGEIVWSQGFNGAYQVWSNLRNQISSGNLDRDPDINDNGEIIWRFGDGGAGQDGIMSNKRGVIYTESGNTTDPYYNTHRINNKGEVVWSNDIDIWSNIRGRLTMNTQGNDRQLAINDLGEVVYLSYSLAPDRNYFDIISTEQGFITNDPKWERDPDINDSGEIVWEADGEIWSNKRGRIATNGKSPSINNLGEIIWAYNDGNDWEIYSNLRGQITDNNVADTMPHINDSGAITWLSNNTIMVTFER